MYEKILRWHKNHPEKPVNYAIVVACIYALKVDPEEFYNNKFVFGKEKFIEDCKEKNQFFGQKEAIKTQFLIDEGFSIDDLFDSEIWNELIYMDSINDYIKERTFESQSEIKSLCKKIYSDYLNESVFLDKKKIERYYGKRGLTFLTQMDNLGRSVDNVEKWIEGTANTFWFGSNAIRCITQRTERLLQVEHTPELYRKSMIELKDNFNFSDLQIEMLKYAVCQSKYGDCPASLNKAVYIWGREKGSGKTTIAATIVSILNGEKDHYNIRMYKSTLAQELGFKDFVAPKICSCRAVLMDEAMPKDSSKSYDTLKDRITSDGVDVRFIHKNQQHFPAKANYWFTSNHPLSYFVQDESERRFLEFEINKKYKNLSYKEIYDIFLRFIQQCKREKEWQQWYDDMMKDTEVKGLESKNIEDINSYFESSEFRKEIIYGASQVSIGTFYQRVLKFERIADKNLIKEFVIKKFGQPAKPSIWRKSDILEILDRNPDNTIELTEFGDVNPF